MKDYISIVEKHAREYLQNAGFLTDGYRLSNIALTNIETHPNGLLTYNLEATLVNQTNDHEKQIFYKGTTVYQIN